MLANLFCNMPFFIDTVLESNDLGPNANMLLVLTFFFLAVWDMKNRGI